MKEIPFWKIQAVGNDYVYFDVNDMAINDIISKIPAICHRRFGIGGDGVVLIDFDTHRMTMYNADGSRGAICGNALRAVGYLICKREDALCCTVKTDVGDREVTVVDGLVEATMGKGVILRKLKLRDGDCYIVDVGNLHAVSFDYRKDAQALAEEVSDLLQLDGINAEVGVAGKSAHVVVYERGTGYTLSCGSGACAVGTVMWESGLADIGQEIAVDMPGGRLLVAYRDGLRLKGEVKIVARGVYYAE